MTTYVASMSERHNPSCVVINRIRIGLWCFSSKVGGLLVSFHLFLVCVRLFLFVFSELATSVLRLLFLFDYIYIYIYIERERESDVRNTLFLTLAL